MKNFLEYRAGGGATGVIHSYSGFTLAEVLIILAIIGIVAVMTIPTLISNYKKKTAETKLIKFYSVMNNAVSLSEIDNGPKETWERMSGYENNEDGSVDINRPKALFWLQKYLIPYLKNVEVKLTDAQNTSGYVKLYFSDGSLALVSSASIVYFLSASDFSEIYPEDKTLPVRYNNEYVGTKSFTFMFCPNCPKEGYGKYHSGKGVEPYAYTWNGDIDKLKNDNTLGCKEKVSNERAYCTKLIQMNNWKIPDDYPLKF